MISTVDLFKEIKIMEEVAKGEKDVLKKANLKAAILNLKLLHNLRTNSVLIMEKLGVEKVKSERVNEPAKEQKEGK
jgi:hypothetical protein